MENSENLINNSMLGAAEPLRFTRNAYCSLSGTADPKSFVAIYNHGQYLATVPVADDGKWRFTPEIAYPEGEQIFQVQGVDAAGNTSALGAPIKVIVDTIAPDAPQIIYVDGVENLLNNGATTNKQQTTLSGEAEADSTIKVYANGNLVGQTTADAQGQWTLTVENPPLGSEVSYTATATDRAKWVSDPSESVHLFISEQGPAKPVIIYGYTNGNSAFDDFSGLQADPIGKVYRNDFIHIDNAIYHHLAGSEWGKNSGSFTHYTMGESLTLGATTSVITFDTVAKSFSFLVTGTNGGTITMKDSQGVILMTFTLPPSTDNANLYICSLAAPGNKLIGSLEINDPGGANFTHLTANSWLPLSDEGLIYGPAWDGAHVTTITESTAVPAIVISNIPVNGVTDDQTPVFRGKVGIGCMVRLFDSDNLLGEAKVDADGTWTFIVPLNKALDAGEHSIRAVATDAQGHSSLASEPFKLTVQGSSKALHSQAEEPDLSMGSLLIVDSGEVFPTPPTNGSTTLKAEAVTSEKVQPPLTEDYLLNVALS